MKKILSIVTLLVLLISSAFATNWKKYGTYKDKFGVYELYFDYDATEPFELEKEDIRYIMKLQFWYNATIIWEKYYDDEPYVIGTKRNCYSTLVLYKNDPWANEYHVNKDGTITCFSYVTNGHTFEDIMKRLSYDPFEKPRASLYKEDK